jgi:probable HAF family extracellular repeat protein
MRTRSDASFRFTAVRRPALGLIFAATTIAASADAAPTYTVTDLGVPDGVVNLVSVQAQGLNSLGEVTGFFRLSDGSQHAFLYSRGVMQDLGTLLDGTSSVGIAVNAASQVTGSSRVSASSSVERAFLHNGVFMQDLGTLGGPLSQGRGINASGEVTGEASLDATVRHAFRFNGTFMEDLGVLGGSTSHGFAINDIGMITGGSTSVAGPLHAFLYDGVEMRDLGTLGGFTSEGRGINASGQVTGFSFTIGGSQHAFFYDGVTMNDLGTLGGAKSFGNGINADGFVVGTSDIDQTTATHAFLYDGSAMHDLNDLLTGLPQDVTIELQSAQFGGSINDAGQIAVTGVYLSGGPSPFAQRAFLLTPVPEPMPAASTLMAAATLAGFGLANRTSVSRHRVEDRAAQSGRMPAALAAIRCGA